MRHIALALLLLALPLTALAQDCLDYSDFTHWSGAIPGINGQVIVHVDGLLYIGAVDGLHIADVSAPHTPEVLGHTGGSVMGMVLAYPYIYATGQNFQIFDISDPAAPTVTATVSMPGYSYDTVKSGDYCYTLFGANFTTFDVSDPAAPVAVAELTLPEPLNTVELLDNLAYVTSNDDEIYIIDISEGASPSLAATIPFDGNQSHPFCLRFRGNYAYIGLMDGLLIYDITDPLAPLFVSYLNNYWVADLDLAGDFAYIVGENYGLLVVDVSDPAAPFVEMEMPLGMFSSAIDVEGGYAYVGVGTMSGYEVSIVGINNLAQLEMAGTAGVTGEPRKVAWGDDVACVGSMSGLTLFDISDPAAVITLAYYPIGDCREGDIAVKNGHVYCAANGIVAVVDITDPTEPVRLDDLHTATYRVWDVEIRENLAYVAHDVCLTIYDVTDPASPVQVGEHCSIDGFQSMALCGDYAYLTEMMYIYIVDISDPSAPFQVGEEYLEEINHDVHVECAGGYLYVSGQANDGHAIEVYDLTNPHSPARVGYTATQGTAGDPLGFEIAGNYLYQAAGFNGMQVIDIGDPTSPTPVVSAETGGIAWDAAVAGEYALLALDGIGLGIISIGGAMAAPVMGVIDTPGLAGDVVLTGRSGHAFIADGEAGLQVADVTDPTAPVNIGGIDLIGFAHAVDVEGSLAAVAVGSSGCRLLDISTAETPLLLGEAVGAVTVYDVALRGGYLYAVGDAGCDVFDVADPAAPVHVQTLPLGGIARGIDFAGDYACVAAGSAGLIILDIADPELVGIAAALDTNGDARDVVVDGDYAFLADGSAGLCVIDLTDPAAPALAAGFTTAGSAERLDHGTGFLYVTGDAGLEVVDVSNPTGPIAVGQMARGEAVTVHGGRVYLPDGANGLQIGWCQCGDATGIAVPALAPRGLRLATPFPNPFNPSVKLTFTLSDRQRLVAEIFDVRGRRVKRLADGVFNRGDGELTWDGRDDRGHNLPSGLYFARLEAGGSVATRKLTLLK
ncbi:MAG: hypothetical protein GY835_07920 [bacterium]|nr:hypothetical protein [bacterium]